MNGFDVYRILARLYMQSKENVRKALRKQSFSGLKGRVLSPMRIVYDWVEAFVILLFMDYDLVLG